MFDEHSLHEQNIQRIADELLKRSAPPESKSMLEALKVAADLEAREADATFKAVIRDALRQELYSARPNAATHSMPDVNDKVPHEAKGSLSRFAKLPKGGKFAIIGGTVALLGGVGAWMFHVKHERQQAMQQGLNR